MSKNENIPIDLSILLYGAKTWTVHMSHVKKLHAFMMRHLNIKWQDFTKMPAEYYRNAHELESLNGGKG